MSDVVELVEQFCRVRDVAFGTHIRAVPSLFAAFDIVEVKGPDRRWSTIAARRATGDLPEKAAPTPTARAERQTFDAALRESAFPGHRHQAPRPWHLSYTATSLAHWSRLSLTLREAHRLGLGWIVPANRDLLLVPLPRMQMAEGRSAVLHNDAGEWAVSWPDGTGLHFLNGVHFRKPLYDRVFGGQLRLSEIAALPNADQRSIALTYLKFDHLVYDAGAVMINRGARGTALYRLRLPMRIVRDRPHGYGEFDYFIHMRDASHPEREFIEWVDPAIGRRGDAELCQAHAFGITLDQWLSIEQEG